MTTTREEISALVREELSHVIANVPAIQYELTGVMAQTFAQRTDLQAILERIDAQGERIEALREDFNRQFAEHSRRMDELREDFNRGFAHLSARIDWMDSTLGALGARWGLMSESAFRSGLAAILAAETGMYVENYRKMDTRGVVFREPDQVEIDVVIHDGTHSLIEIKSSISRGDVEHFHRKVTSYEQEEDAKVERMLIISPMFGPRARELALLRGMEVYSSVYDVPRL